MKNIEYILGVTAFITGCRRMTASQFEFLGLAAYFITYMNRKETTVYKGEFLWFNDWERLFQGVFPVFLILSAFRAVTDAEVACPITEETAKASDIKKGDDEETESLKNNSGKNKKDQNIKTK